MQINKHQTLNVPMDFHLSNRLCLFLEFLSPGIVTLPQPIIVVSNVIDDLILFLSSAIIVLIEKLQGSFFV